MPSVSVLRSSEVVRSPRVLQMEGMFDVPPSQRSEVCLNVNLPIDEFDWNIGLIVGCSGSGKSTVARELFPDAIVNGYDWDRDRSVLDGFPKGMSITDITELLCKVGFGSPPNWLRPFHVLSNGEQFRVTMARAIAQESGLIVVDEFTSVIDRQVAQVASHCVQKVVRRLKRKFIAVSCHYDIIDWLQPDWIYQPSGDQFQRRSLRRRPEIDLAVHPVDKTAWKLFSQYHYLNRSLAAQAKCFGGFINGECVAFTSYINFPHPKTNNIRQGHRLVVHPDYQGLGIGGMLDDWLGQHLYEQSYRYHNVIAHPAMIAYYSHSPRWHRARSGFLSGSDRCTLHKSFKDKQNSFSAQRISHTFVYTPPAS